MESKSITAGELYTEPGMDCESPRREWVGHARERKGATLPGERHEPPVDCELLETLQYLLLCSQGLD